MKTCSKCGEEKARSEFYKLSRSKDGLQSECRVCRTVVVQAHYQANREALLAKNAAYRQANPEAQRERDAAYHRANREARCATMGANYQANKAAYIARNRAREKHISRATPPWADLSAIQFFYECRPEGCHVDHVIPLRGETVSGLHVESNLQWLPAEENIRKSNRV